MVLKEATKGKAPWPMLFCGGFFSRPCRCGVSVATAARAPKACAPDPVRNAVGAAGLGLLQAVWAFPQGPEGVPWTAHSASVFCGELLGIEERGQSLHSASEPLGSFPHTSTPSLMRGVAGQGGVRAVRTPHRWDVSSCPGAYS